MNICGTNNNNWIWLLFLLAIFGGNSCGNSCGNGCGNGWEEIIPLIILISLFGNGFCGCGQSVCGCGQSSCGC
ncbi:MAG: chorion class high-cysteine HCB protein 13 [Clostridia bacterium]|nr:chorion class high-cysteine HCB protein 13 [Clostridia bacterium]